MSVCPACPLLSIWWGKRSLDSFFQRLCRRHCSSWFWCRGWWSRDVGAARDPVACTNVSSLFYRIRKRCWGVWGQEASPKGPRWQRGCKGCIEKWCCRTNLEAQYVQMGKCEAQGVNSILTFFSLFFFINEIKTKPMYVFFLKSDK